MKNYFSIILLLLFTQISFSQKIKGEVIDSLGNKVSLAIVQLYNSDQNISATQSENNGTFEVETNAISFPLQLKVNHINYKSKTLTLNSLNYIKIVLNARQNTLENLIIEKDLDVKRKRDTLAFNLAKLLNGSEILLRDVIEKLPGLSIDNNNKIRYNGSIIDHLLLDGDKFFGKQHQLATENITAEMIEKIELLTKFKDLSHIEGFDDDNVKALNISLKNKFKFKLKGNLETEAGISARYKIHNNLFNYGKKAKFNLITNSNNVNYNIISLTDYLDFRNQTGANVFKEQFIGGMSSSSESNIPSFIFALDNSKYRDIKNATLNFARKINTNQRFEFVSIANKIKQTDINTSIQNFINNQTPDSYNQTFQNGNSLFWHNKLEFENKISNTSNYKINGYVLLTNDAEKQDIQNEIPNISFINKYNNNNSLQSTKIGANVMYKNKISNNVMFNTGIYTDYINSKNKKQLQGTENFTWFNYANNNVEQNTNAKQTNMGALASAVVKHNKQIVSLRLISNLETENLNNINTINSFNFTNNFVQATNTFSAKYLTYILKKIQLVLDAKYVNNNISVSNKFDKKLDVFLPGANIMYSIYRKTNLAIGYSQDVETFSSTQFLSGNLLNNFRSYTQASTLLPQVLKNKNLSVSLSYSDIDKNFNTSLNYYNSNKNKTFSYNTQLNDLVTNQELMYINGNKENRIYYSIDKKFQAIPFGGNFYVNSTNNKVNLFVNGQLTQTTNTNTFFNLTARSYLKASPFNFNFGTEYSVSSTKSENYTSDLTQFSPFLKFSGAIFNKKLNWELNNKYHYFNATLLKSDPIYDLGFKFIYNVNPKYNLYLQGANVLNIRENNFKNQFISSDVYTLQMLTNTLSGYINIGFKINY